ncbi:glycerol-3-phosphate phosphatase [Schistocerca cancellata]|uniref:glycerol-3-phosphate phosphatase n=1 Tax=Schistocerca cancellata TaxID=274614 RepID=UPI002118A887|nr:glycerol-3-phosphate phosphatase [Schistocerca cancellata]
MTSSGCVCMAKGTMKTICLTSLGKHDIKGFINSFDTVLTDCDGVLWLGSELIPGANIALNTFRNLGKKIFYVTNNSTKSREEYIDKFRKLGFVASEEEILSSSYLSARYLNDIGFKKKVYVFGTSGITKELDKVGIRHTEVGPDPMVCDMGTLVSSKTNLDPEVGAVIVGFDEQISYPKILKAGSYLKNPDCLFLATNTDQQFPSKSNVVIPGAGCMVAAVECCAGRKPKVIGKPGDYIRDYLIKKHNINPQRTLMIGDRGNTDILLGTRCGFKTLMVLTGVSSLVDIEQWEKSDDKEILGCVPNYYVNTLADVVPLLPK